MRSVAHRIISPLYAWIPDISAVPARRQVSIGIIASIVLHLVLLLLAGLLTGFVQEQFAELVRRVSPPEVQEIELTVVPPAPKEEPPALALEALPQRAFLDSRGLQEASEAAKDAIIESDKNMKAASEMPATGDLPLPSQEGLNRPSPAFTTQEDILGGKTPPLALAQQKPVPMEAAPAAEEPPPTLYKPQPIPKENIDPATQQPAMDKPAPKTAVETPPKLPEVAEMNALAQRALDKLKQVMEADDDEIALTTKPLVEPPKELTEPPLERLKPVPVPQPKAAATPMPRPISTPAPRTTPAPRQEMAKLTTPAPRPSQSGYQPQLQKTRIEGSISNRGRAAVDAVSTPMARYKKQVNDAIGSRWYYYIRGKMDLIAAGSVNMSFSINDRGEAVGVRVDSNTSNQSLADVCERAIREAELEPPPPELLAPLKDGRLEYSLTFTFYNL